MQKDEVARNVRVKLKQGYEPKSISQRQLMEIEHYLFIPRQEVYNDKQEGEYTFVSGSSGTNSSTFYLKDLELEFPADDKYRGIFKGK